MGGREGEAIKVTLDISDAEWREIKNMLIISWACGASPLEGDAMHRLALRIGLLVDPALRQWVQSQKARKEKR